MGRSGPFLEKCTREKKTSDILDGGLWLGKVGVNNGRMEASIDRQFKVQPLTFCEFVIADKQAFH